MGEFRIGMGGSNARAQHVYPDNPRAAALGLFARNFATGPKVDTAIGAGVQIPWNLIDSTSRPFTIAAGGITVSIPGDVTSQFSNGDSVRITPTTPAVLPPVTGSIATAPVFASGVTTFDLSAPIDVSTTAGTIEDASSGVVDVPITPRATGVVRIMGVVTVSNASGSTISAQIVVQVGGVALPVPAALQTVIPNNGIAAIPFLAETELPIGSTSNIEIFVTGSGGTILTDSSSIEVQEVSVATG